MSKEIFICSFCGFQIGWQESDYSHGTMWSCERCGTTFCTACAVDKIGRKAYDEMMQTGERVLCPDCIREEQHGKAPD